MPGKVNSINKPDYETFLKRVPASSTPLHQAALFGYLDYAQKILEGKSDKDIKKLLLAEDSYNNLPLDRAAPRGHDAVLEYLLSKHKESGTAYPDPIPNKQQYTPLLSAIRWYFNVLNGSYDQGQVIGQFNTQTQGSESQFQHVQTAFHKIINQLITEFPQHLKKGTDNKGHNALYYLIWIYDDAKKKRNDKKTEWMLADYETIAKEVEIIYTLLLKKGMSLDESHSNKQSPRGLAKKINSKLPQSVEKEIAEIKEHGSKGFDSKKVTPNSGLKESAGFFAEKKAEVKSVPAFTDSKELIKYIKEWIYPKTSESLKENEIEVIKTILMQTLSKYSDITDKKKQEEIFNIIPKYIEVVGNEIIIKEKELDLALDKYASENSLTSKPI